MPRTPPTTFKDKACPCGLTFTPKSGRQKYHATDCPAREADKAVANGRMSAAERDSYVKGAAANGNGKAEPEILVRLIGDCDRELEAIDAQLEEFRELQERREGVARVRETLASV